MTRPGEMKLRKQTQPGTTAASFAAAKPPSNIRVYHNSGNHCRVRGGDQFWPFYMLEGQPAAPRNVLAVSQLCDSPWPVAAAPGHHPGRAGVGVEKRDMGRREHWDRG